MDRVVLVTAADMAARRKIVRKAAVVGDQSPVAPRPAAVGMGSQKLGVDLVKEEAEAVCCSLSLVGMETGCKVVDVVGSH